MLTPTTGISLADYNAAVLNGSHTHARLVFPVQNITLTDDNISADGGLVINDLLNPDTDLIMGKAVSKELIIRFINSSVFNGFDWAEEFRLDFGVDISGSTKWVTYGYFKGKKPKRTVRVQTIEFIAMDRMQSFDILADEFLESIVYPATMEDIFQALCAYVGLTYVQGSENSSIMAMEYAESHFVPGISCRRLLAYIAEANCCYAVITADGDVKLKWFSDQTENYTLTEDQHFSPEIDEVSAPEIDAIRISSTEEEATNSIYPITGFTTVYNIVDNPLLLALGTTDRTTVSVHMLNRFAAFGEYTPMIVTAIGNWMVETGDIIEVEHDGGHTTNMPVFGRSIQWDGGCIDQYECTGAADRDELNNSAMEQYEQGGKLSGKYSIISGIDINDDGIDISGSKYLRLRSGGIMDIDAQNFKINSEDKEMVVDDWKFNSHGLYLSKEIGGLKHGTIFGDFTFPDILFASFLKFSNYTGIRSDGYYSPEFFLEFKRNNGIEPRLKMRPFDVDEQPFNGVYVITDYYDWNNNTVIQNTLSRLGDNANRWDIYARNLEAKQFTGDGVANNLTQTAAGKVLDARQGKELKDLVDEKTGCKKLGTINNSTKTIIFSGTVRFLLVVDAVSDARKAMFICYGRTASCSALQVVCGSDLVVTEGTGNIKVKNNSSNDANVYAIILEGNSNDIG